MGASKLAKHYARLTGEWINFYDRDDVIAYPLRSLNPAYKAVITDDREINVGGSCGELEPARSFTVLGRQRCR